MSTRPTYEFNFRTRSANAIPAGLQDDLYWYDTGDVVNDEPVFYDANDVYAIWNDGADWILTVVDDVNNLSAIRFYSSSDRQTWTATLLYPPQIGITGNSSFEGISNFAGVVEGRPSYFNTLENYTVLYNATLSRWEIKAVSVLAFIDSQDDLPPLEGWTVLVGFGDIEIEYLLAPGTRPNFWNGTVSEIELNISNSWSRAEKTVFDSLVAFTGSKETVNAFRGRFPTNEDGSNKWRNVWRIESGGTAGAFPVERTYGDNGNWCNLLIDAEIEGVFKSREIAMNFASTVLAWLKSTQNMAQVGNVTWCMITGLPTAPEPEVGIKYVDWFVTIPLQILMLTESEHS